MKINLLLAVIAFTGIALHAQCGPVSTLDEDFNNFEYTADQDFPQNCWTGDMHIKELGTSGNKYVEYFNAMVQNLGQVLITPELTSIAEDRMLTFDAYKLNNGSNVLFLRVGTFDQQDGGSGFVPFSEQIPLTLTPTTYNMVITAAETQKFIVFEVAGNATHMMSSIDNVKYSPIADVKNFDKTLFSIYPNPSVGKNITIKSNFTAKALISIYTMTGVSVYAEELDNSDTQNLDLSSLSAGLYIVRVTSGTISESKKLVIN